MVRWRKEILPLEKIPKHHRNVVKCPDTEMMDEAVSEKKKIFLAQWKKQN